jgi:Mrp family chromosome partitioning ATPase
MRELLGILRNRFDVIVIDTPPSLAVSEPRQLARKSDATVLIARAGETKEKELEYAVRQLERVGAKIVGVVLNGFNLDMAYGYKYRYSQYGEYGHYADYGS